MMLSIFAKEEVFGVAEPYEGVLHSLPQLPHELADTLAKAMIRVFSFKAFLDFLPQKRHVFALHIYKLMHEILTKRTPPVRLKLARMWHIPIIKIHLCIYFTVIYALLA